MLGESLWMFSTFVGLHLWLSGAPLCFVSGLAGRHVAQAQLMHSCLAAVKASMLVLQRSQDALDVVLQAQQDDSTLEDSLGGLLSCYIHILTDGEKC